jgi:branched-chain amino acid transport system substrate-binding protein
MRRLKPFSVLFLAALLLLTACGGGGGYTKPAHEAPRVLTDEQAGPPTPAATQPAIPSAQNLRPVKVGILLPLTGKDQQLGQSMLKAAQMALFDVGYEGFELIPRDTKSSPQEAATAARSAIAGGAELLLGPIFSESVAAVKPVAKQSNINVIAFTTDWKHAGGGAFIMGFLPFDQIQRVAQFAAAQNVRSVGVLAPTTDYGQITLSAFQSAAGRNNMQVAATERFNPQTREIAATLRQFTRYDQRHPNGQPSNAPAPFDAVFMPVGGDSAKTIGNMLTQLDLPPSRVKRLGTGLFDDPSLSQEPGLDGSWFAAPSPGARSAFERRFQQSYGYAAPRLTTLAYDATALAAILAKRGLQGAGNKPGFDTESLMNPNGFSGIDGIFRFRPDGTAERGLAILEIRRGGISVIEEAPKPSKQRRSTN